MAEAVPEEELTIPRAAMNKMIKEIVPSVRVANEARELILNCCSEFIHLLASEANDICTQQQKKTINAEHILGGSCYHCTLYYIFTNTTYQISIRQTRFQ